MYTQNATSTHFLAAQKSGRALQLSGTNRVSSGVAFCECVRGKLGDSYSGRTVGAHQSVVEERSQLSTRTCNKSDLGSLIICRGSETR